MRTSVLLDKILGDQTKLRGYCRIKVLFVSERHWLKCQDRFTGFVHRLNVFLKPPGRHDRPQLAI
jgi:hypothetical protein